MVRGSERLDLIVKRLGNKIISSTKIRKEIKLLGDPSDIIYVGNELWKKIIGEGLKCSTKTISFLGDVIYEANERARDLSTRDHLTGLSNRRVLDSELKKQFSLTYRNFSNPFSVIMFDVDYFKVFNDVYGHNAGDIVLKVLSDVVSDSIRDSDVAFRYGGEEFIILLPNTSKSDALDVAYRLNSQVANKNVVFVDENGKKHRKPVTVSVGVMEIDWKNPIWLLYGVRGKKLVIDYVREDSDFEKALDNYIKLYSMNHSFISGEKLTKEDVRKNVKRIGDFVKSGVMKKNFCVTQCATDWIVKEVDNLMYYAKKRGRNCVAYIDSEGMRTIEKSR